MNNDLHVHAFDKIKKKGIKLKKKKKKKNANDKKGCKVKENGFSRYTEGKGTEQPLWCGHACICNSMAGKRTWIEQLICVLVVFFICYIKVKGHI